jgi:hypothetical protein
MRQLKKIITWVIMMTAVIAVFQSCKKSPAAPDYNSNKSALSAKIDSAIMLYNSTVGGNKPGDYDVNVRLTLKAAIDLANGVKTGTFTQYQVNNAQANLGRVISQYKNTFVQEVSVANLVAFWKLNGNAVDSSGNGHNGALKTGYVGSSASTATDGGTLPALVADRFGRANMAYHFNNGANIDVPYSQALNPQSFTISLWLSRDGTNSNNYFFSFNRWNGYKFQLQSSNLPFLTIQTTTGYHDVDDGGASVPLPNVWTHVAVSFTPGQEKFYINGVLVRTADVSGNPIPVPSSIDLAIGNEMVKSNYNLTDSNNPNYFWGADYFIGSLDDIRFYNTALTDAEIHSIYTIESSL